MATMTLPLSKLQTCHSAGCSWLIQVLNPRGMNLTTAKHDQVSNESAYWGPYWSPVGLAVL